MQKASMYSIKRRVVWLSLGFLAMGSGVAVAADAAVVSPGLLKVAMVQQSPAQIKSFANAVRQIRPLNDQVHAEVTQKGLSATKKEEIKKSYMQKVDGILSANHLSAEQYSSMLKQTQTDPAFAKQVEAAMQ